MRKVLIAAVVCFLAAACGLPFGIGQASTSQLVNGAADTLAKASGFEVSGKFTTGTDKFQVDIQYQSSGSAHVNVTVNTTQVEAIQSNGKVYYHGKAAASTFVGSDAFGQAEPIAVGDKWFTTSKATPMDMSGFTDAGKVKATFLNTISLSRKDDVTVNGVNTAELSDSESIINITESSPYELVRLRTQPGKTSSSASDLDLGFSNYNKDFNISVPTDALNLDDPSTFPPFYQVATINLSRCNGDPCNVSATVQNSAGTKGASAPSTVTFTATNDADSSTLGTCKATISPDVANGAKATVGCSITGGAWTAFVQNGGSFHVKAEPDNPAYD
jgi:flagellar capping protein FliD